MQKVFLNMLLVGSILLAGTSGVLYAEDVDKVFKMDGSVVQLNIDGMSFGRIVHKIANQKQYMDMDDVQSFEFYDVPVDYQRAEKYRTMGRYTEAIRQYEAAMNGKIIFREFIKKQCIPYYIGECHLKAAMALSGDKSKGEFKQALASFKDLIQKNPETFYLGHAREGMVKAHVRLGQLGKADQILVEMEDMPDPWPINAKLQRAILLEDDGKSQEAGDIYQDVISMENRYPIQACTARLRNGYCLLQLKRPDAAIEMFKKVVEQLEERFNMGDNAMNLAQAYNGLGDAYAASEKKESIRHALMSYLRVVVLYTMDETDHAKALYGAANSFERLQEDGWKENAAKLYRELGNRYPNSAWRKKAGRRAD